MCLKGYKGKGESNNALTDLYLGPQRDTRPFSPIPLFFNFTPRFADNRAYYICVGKNPRKELFNAL